MAGLLDKRTKTKYTDEELLEYLIQFSEENGRPPTETDFIYGTKYPCFRTYNERFGSWKKALKPVGLDIDSIVRKGIIETKEQKARLTEILILEHFPEKDKVIDLSGENCNSPYDGICPNGQKYDVKSSGLLNKNRWKFGLDNNQSEDIE